MNIYKQIEQRIMEGSDLVKEVQVEEVNAQVHAMVYPDFHAYKSVKLSMFVMR